MDQWPLALTIGEPAGVGPELVARIATDVWSRPLVAVGDGGSLRRAAAAQRLPLRLHAVPAGPLPALPAGEIYLHDVPAAVPATPGQLDVRNAPAVLAMIDAAADGARDGRYAGIVTAPVHKGIINDAGLPFTGHTERLAERAGCEVLMLLVANQLRVALVTTHLPLREVPAQITAERVQTRLQLLADGLQRGFGCADPLIAMLGLNPHAGEGGHLGHEEQQILIPLLQRLRSEGWRLDGPLPADTAFVRRGDDQPDAFLAMYHDQGLPVLKYAGFGHAVNVTLGLPYWRSSVDHGTALDIAGQGLADPGSLRAALQLALQACERRP